MEAEQGRDETEHEEIELRVADIGSDLLKKLAESRVPELTRMPYALDSDRGFRILLRFGFEGLIHVLQPASPLRYLAESTSGATMVKKLHGIPKYNVNVRG